MANLQSGYLKMTNLRTDEMVFCRNLTKIGTDENKGIHSTILTDTHFISDEYSEYIPSHNLLLL